ncbi:MAG: tetratricopeptide repeat protein [Verrucomicrobia bacterium]|nr:tetratricopeptide repeat protein [Verrucomicrobiota bacterium]
MRLTLAALVPLAFLSAIRAEPDPLVGPGTKHFAPDAVEMGWKYFEQGDHEMALRRFQMAIRHDPDFAPAYFGAAYVYTVDGKLDEAIKNYRETLQRENLFVLACANLGYALLQQGKYPEAIQMLNRAIDIDPKCSEAHLCFAKYYAYKQDWKDAEQSVNKAIKYGQRLDPELREILEKHGVKIAEN